MGLDLTWLKRLQRIGATPVPAPPGPRQLAELMERLRVARSERKSLKATDLLALEAALGRAIANDQLQLLYQPRIDTVSGRIIGAEALLRWLHPDLGLLQPAQFIPYAEETGVILPLSRWVLRAACAQLAQWDVQHLPLMSVSVNLTAHQLTDPQLCTDAVAILDESGLTHARLALEVTETMLTVDRAKALQTLRALQSVGISVTLDDFGTGYTSLSHLEEFPIDAVKIHGSMISNVPGDHADEAMIEAIIDAGRRLQIRVVAKGVETAAQVRFLRQRRCDDMQGFFFCEAVTAAAFAQRVMRDLPPSS